MLRSSRADIIRLAAVLAMALPLPAAGQEADPAARPPVKQDLNHPRLQPAPLGGTTVQGFRQQAAPAPDLKSFDPRADDAYGAFQRGYYLTAMELALERAKTGDPAAQTLIAELYDKGLGIARDGKEAAAWYGLAAAKDYPEAQFAYAIKLLEGKDVKKDAAQARVLMEKAAKSGLVTAQFNLAQMIVAENRDETGLIKAFPMYLAAAKGGVPDAQYALAQIYAEGRGIARNDEQAREWMTKAAQAGFDTAQLELGIWLANGRGGIKDEKAAHGWIERSAVSGNVIAQNRLAKMLAVGLGAPQDDVEAVRWAVLARRAGLEDKWLDDYISGLDPLVVEAGEARAGPAKQASDKPAKGKAAARQ